MKYSIKIAILMLISLSAVAQKHGSDEKRERIRTAKIGMITNRLNLTSEQAPKFWALYNDYEEEAGTVRKRIRQLMLDENSLASSDDKIKKNINEWHALKQKELDIDKEYYQKFIKVISIRQYAELRRSEIMFNQMLLNKIHGKQHEN